MGIKKKGKMNDGRKAQVILLDERKLDISVQPKLLAGEMLDLVASYFNLKEKEYFGLAFKDDSGHFHWLQLDRRVLEHELPNKHGQLILHFAVRFFIESITYLNDNATVELFYLQAKLSIFNDKIECDSETVFKLAGYVLQSSYGDYSDDETAKGNLKKMPVLPTSALKDQLSISTCEEKVLAHYRKLVGLTRGSAIVNYMMVIEGLPTYGIHYYEVKDERGLPWWLGLSYKGISQYDYNDKKVPRKVFAWKQLENLYFRDKKFSIEVHDPKRIVHTVSSFNLYEDAIQEPIEEFDDLSDAISDPTTQVSVSRRTFRPGNVNVYAWFATTPALTKCIWSMAVSQHQFYLDRKQSKTQLPSIRSITEIAANLSLSTSSLPTSNSSSVSRSNSTHSLPTGQSNNTKPENSVSEADSNEKADKDVYANLKARKEALELALQKKTEELKQLCLKEAEKTGELPPEFPLIAGEMAPQVRRRIGTAFTLSPKVVDREEVSKEEELLSRLELEYEIQDKITKAARKLAEDVTTSKGIRRQRRQNYHQALKKLRDLERSLNETRKMCGLQQLEPKYIDSPNFNTPGSSPAPQRKPHSNQQLAEHVEAAFGHTLSPLSEGTGFNRSGSPAGLAIRDVQGYSRESSPSPYAHRRWREEYIADAQYQPQSTYQYQTHSPNYQHFSSPDHVLHRQPEHKSDNSYVQQSVQHYGNYNQYPSPESYHSSPAEPNKNIFDSGIRNSPHYRSADELGRYATNDKNLNEFRNQEAVNQVWFSKHDSLEDIYGRRNYDGYMPQPPNENKNYQQEYHASQFPQNSYKHEGPYHNYVVPKLAPSRYGSKKESTSDYPNSAYPNDEYMGFSTMSSPSNEFSSAADYENLKPYPYENQNYIGARRDDAYIRKNDPRSTKNGASPYDGQNYIPEGALNPHISKMGHNSNMPYSDHNDPMPSYERYSYESFQQQSPQSPLREFSRTYSPWHDTDNNRTELYASSSSTDSPQAMTVTQYQSYTEVTKPFEMSDFYKYSEKIRKQRTINSRQQRFEAVLSGQPLPNCDSDEPPPTPTYYSPVNQGHSFNSPDTYMPSMYQSPVRSPSPSFNSSQGYYS